MNDPTFPSADLHDHKYERPCPRSKKKMHQNKVSGDLSIFFLSESIVWFKLYKDIDIEMYLK